MTETSHPQDWPELLVELRKLTALIEPLQKIMAQEEAPALSERVDQFVTEISLIRGQMERAVAALEADTETRERVLALTLEMANQKQQMARMEAGIARVLRLMGEPAQSKQGR